MFFLQKSSILLLLCLFFTIKQGYCSNQDTLAANTSIPKFQKRTNNNKTLYISPKAEQEMDDLRVLIKDLDIASEIGGYGLTRKISPNEEVVLHPISQVKINGEFSSSFFRFSSNCAGVL